MQAIRLMTWLPVLTAAALAPAPVLAQDAPPAERHTAELGDGPPKKETSWTASLGGTLNTGNTESWQVNAGSSLSLLRAPHSFRGDVQFAYGQARLDGEDAYQDTVRNFNGNLHYSYFFNDHDGLFSAVSHRWDTFAGLDTRLQTQAGYVRNFFRKAKHRFWGELGYDFTYDNLHPDPLVNDMGEILPGTAEVHSGRVYLGYENELNEAVTFKTHVETLINLQTPDDVRINWDNALRSTLTAGLKLELLFNLKFDSIPVPTRQKLDTRTQVNLIYTLVEQKPGEDS
jgi:putative salt-induced outer membrane protein YdiY